MISIETAAVVVIIVAAGVYVFRSWMPRKTQPGCGSCPANANRREDYT